MDRDSRWGKLVFAWGGASALALLLAASLVVAQGQSPAQPAKKIPAGLNDTWKSSEIQPLVERLETESREIYHERAKLAALVAPKSGSAVADVGAGSGFMVLEFARLVGAAGTIYAVDINATMMEHVARRAREQNLSNVRTVVTPEDSLNLPPNSVDLIFVCDTYHHFEFPEASLAGIHRALRPGGQLVVVEFKREPGKSQQWILDHVRAGQQEVTREIAAAGFELVEALHPAFLSENYLLRFRKK
jgi:ubiquinone/menaquinone biosynthesis C-methylase UbiE